MYLNALIKGQVEMFSDCAPYGDPTRLLNACLLPVYGSAPSHMCSCFPIHPSMKTITIMTEARKLFDFVSFQTLYA